MSRVRVWVAETALWETRGKGCTQRYPSPADADQLSQPMIQSAGTMEGGTDTCLQNFLWAPLQSVCNCRTFLLVGHTLWGWSFSVGGPDLLGLDQQICAFQLFNLGVCTRIRNCRGCPKPDWTGPDQQFPWERFSSKCGTAHVDRYKFQLTFFHAFCQLGVFV